MRRARRHSSARRGLTAARLNACLADRSRHRAARSRSPAARSELGVDGTPTFVDQRPVRPDTDDWARLEPLLTRAGARARGRAGRRADQAAQAVGLQELRRAGRTAHRAGADRGRRPQRLRQVQPARGDPLGDGRKLAQVDARRAGWTT